MYKRFIIWALAVVIGAILVSCETDFVTETTGPTMPVVYSIIDPQDSIHYLRLSKTFKGGNNAYESALVSDSIAFSDAKVKLEFFNEEGWKYNDFQFDPVPDFNKINGIFTSEGEQLFKLEKNLLDRFIPGSYVMISISLPNNQLISSSFVQHLEPLKITAPRNGFGTRISFYPPNPTKIRFEDLAHFTYYELHVRFSYTNVFYDESEEAGFVNKVYTRHSSNSVADRPSEIIITVFGDNYFAIFPQQIPENKDVKYRRVGGIEFWVFTGSPEFYEYLELSKHVSDMAGASITNIVNGTGIFALKYHDIRKGFELDYQTRDSLINGRFTRAFNFLRW